jgi:hypothetical protein
MPGQCQHIMPRLCRGGRLLSEVLTTGPKKKHSLLGPATHYAFDRMYNPRLHLDGMERTAFRVATDMSGRFSGGVCVASKFLFRGLAFPPPHQKLRGRGRAWPKTSRLGFCRANAHFF